MLTHSTRWKAAHLSGYESRFPTSPSPFSTTWPLRSSLHQIYRVDAPHDGPRNIPPRSHPWASLSATMPKYFQKCPEESVLKPSKHWEVYSAGVAGMGVEQISGQGVGRGSREA